MENTENKKVDLENEVDMTEETKPEGFFTKAWNATKKNGKKIAAGAAIAVGGFILYALGKASGAADSDEYYYLDETPDVVIDVTTSEEEK